MCDGRWVVSCDCRWLWGRAKQLAVHQHYHLLPGAGLADCQTSAQIIDGSVQAAAEVCQSVQTLWQTYKVQSILQLCVQSGPEAITANNNGINKWTWNDSSDSLHIITTLYLHFEGLNRTTIDMHPAIFFSTRMDVDILLILTWTFKWTKWKTNPASDYNRLSSFLLSDCNLELQTIHRFQTIMKKAPTRCLGACSIVAL